MVFNTIKRKFPLIAIHAYSRFSHKLFTARCPMETYLNRRNILFIGCTPRNKI